MTTGPTDRRRRSTGAVDSSLAVVMLVLGVLLAYAVAGLIAGVVWEAIWAPPDQVVHQHQVYPADYQALRRIFTGTGIYVLVAAGASALTALVITLVTRRRELVVLFAVAVGSSGAAGVMREVGISRGPADPTTRAASTPNGVHLPGALGVTGFSPYLVWPMMSLLVLSLVFFTWPRTHRTGGHDGFERGDPSEPSMSGDRRG